MIGVLFMEKPFIRGKTYSRNDIYLILNVPIEKQKGIWNTGYVKFENDWFLFANINTSGRTGHDYANTFIGDDLEWYGKTQSTLNNKSIKTMLEPAGNIYIFIREDNNNPNFVYQGNARTKQYFDTKPVKIMWEFIDEKENHPEKLAEEISEPQNYYEGATKSISVNVYERNPIARKKCIDHYGCICIICGFNFEEIYGDIGKDYIHVHHLVELSIIGKKYEIDPIKDLCPVCPNCHAMLHKKTPAISINGLQEIIKNKKIKGIWTIEEVELL
jgi:predicted HNH restriction endonuclease